jgi:STE24 endopeptidase
MNAIGSVILAALVLAAALDFLADMLNLRRMREELPAACAGWYDSERYRKSQIYLRVNTRFGCGAAAVDLTVLLAFWFGGGFRWLDEWVSRLALAPVFSGLIFIGVLVAAKALISQPFSAYATFVIEARFGFNQTTWRTYIFDRLKGLGLSIVLGGPLLAAVLLFFQSAGANAWWYCWLLTVAFMLLMHYIAPTWILPLFNRFTPLPEGELRSAITAYARGIGFGLDNVLVMDGSKRSTKANAFFTGFGRHRRIALFDTLIEKHSVDELVAVLAHEIGHYRQRHILKMMIIGITQAGLMFYLLSWFISYPPLFASFGIETPSVHAGLVFFGLLYTPLDLLLGMVVQYVSRRHEFAADRFAVDTAPRGHALAAALKKLSVDNLSNLDPHPFYVFLHYSHPPVLQRVAAIEDRKSTRLNSSHNSESRMPSSA